MNLGFLDKALDGLEGRDLGALVGTLQQAAARTLEFDGEYPAQQVAARCRAARLPPVHKCPFDERPQHLRHKRVVDTLTGYSDW